MTKLDFLSSQLVLSSDSGASKLSFCEEPTIPSKECVACDPPTVPRYVSVVMPQFDNDFCTDCNDFAGQHILDGGETPGCDWVKEWLKPELPCPHAAARIEFSLFVAPPPNLTVRVRFRLEPDTGFPLFLHGWEIIWEFDTGAPPPLANCIPISVPFVRSNVLLSVGASQASCQQTLPVDDQQVVAASGPAAVAFLPGPSPSPPPDLDDEF